MLNLYELEQLAAFAQYGTLFRTAETLHISQPTLTRTMQHLEDEFGVALFVHGKKRHALAGCLSITLEMLNGYNCLLKSDIGFWSGLCHKTMPASRFLVQTDEFEFRELAQSSTLPYFVTNLASDADFVKGRAVIPISDAEANVTFHMIFRKENQKYQRTARQRS